LCLDLAQAPDLGRWRPERPVYWRWRLERWQQSGSKIDGSYRGGSRSWAVETGEAMVVWIKNRREPERWVRRWIRRKGNERWRALKKGGEGHENRVAFEKTVENRFIKTDLL
jgi:hypothetical protein